MAKGSWDDGTTADKPVVLNGFEGDTLKLSAGQIPAVGSKPDAEYQAGSWDTVPSTDAAITGNKTFTYTYSPKGTISRTVTFYVVNGSWDDGIAESKSVTLTGKEGDTLKLSADQIPAVGSKPDANYKEGSWNTVPDTTNAITADTAYTYTYEKMDPVTPEDDKDDKNGSVITADLKLGSQGTEVQALQQRLAALGYYNGAIDGDFGRVTDTAVKAFQRANGLYVDGVVGPLTRQALGYSAPTSSQ